MEITEKIFNGESCPNCGSDVIIHSTCGKDNDSNSIQWLCDGDYAVCYDKCGWEGAISVDEDNAWLQDGNIDELCE